MPIPLLLGQMEMMEAQAMLESTLGVVLHGYKKE